MSTSRRSFHWLSRKNGDGGAAKKPKATQVLNDACISRQHPIAPLPERPKPEASVATSRIAVVGWRQVTLLAIATRNVCCSRSVTAIVDYKSKSCRQYPYTGECSAWE